MAQGNYRNVKRKCLYGPPRGVLVSLCLSGKNLGQSAPLPKLLKLSIQIILMILSQLLIQLVADAVPFSDFIAS